MENKEKNAFLGFGADADNVFCFPDTVLKAFADPICGAFFVFFGKTLPVFPVCEKNRKSVVCFLKKHNKRKKRTVK